MNLREARNQAANSPSIALERGVGRLRAPTRRRPGPSFGSSSPSNTPKHRPNATLLPLRGRCSFHLVLLSIGIATVAVFIILAFLLGRSWRWESFRSLFHLAQLSRPPEKPQTNASIGIHYSSSRSRARPITRITTASQTVSHNLFPDQKYITWLPHSGFHNQRVSFENALILARMLNRTLIIPPIRLGKIIRYGEFDKLHRHVTLSSKFGLEYCARTSSFTSFVPPECIGYSEFTMLPWSALIDLPAVAQVVPVVERWDSSPAWLKRYMNITRSDTIYVKDSRPYQFQIYDARTNDRPVKPKYAERLDVEDLEEKYSTYKLIEFGSLFGSSRFRLVLPQNKQTRREVRERMVFANFALLRVAREIAEALGEPHYHALHLRLGDGEFEHAGAANVRRLWWSLTVGLMGLPMDHARQVEASAMGPDHPTKAELPEPPPMIDHPTSEETPSSAEFSFDDPLTLSRPPFSFCRPKIANITQLNYPVFIATDAPHPRSNPALALFLRTLPCVFFLSDFDGPGAPLSAIDGAINEDDGLGLKGFLMPFVDSMVAAMASPNGVIGTPHSTFSGFTVNVMNRMYHGLPIIEKGI